MAVTLHSPKKQHLILVPLVLSLTIVFASAMTETVVPPTSTLVTPTDSTVPPSFPTTVVPPTSTTVTPSDSTVSPSTDTPTPLSSIVDPVINTLEGVIGYPSSATVDPVINTLEGVIGYPSSATVEPEVKTLVGTVYRPLSIESCDSNGAKKDTFGPSDDVYVNGSGYLPSTTYDIYVVEDVATWTDGIAIPPRVPGTATSVSSDASGNIPPTLVWTGPLVPGKYDIVVDVDGDGIYNADTDALDDSDIEVTAGFFIVPEVALGTIMALVAMIIALVAYVAVPKWRRKQTYATP